MGSTEERKSETPEGLRRERERPEGVKERISIERPEGLRRR